MDMPSDPPVIEPLAIPGAEMPAPPKMDIPEAARTLAKKSKTEEKPESSRPDKTESNPEISAPVQARVDVMPKLRRSIKPKYPKVSRERGEEGRIRLRLEINAKGLVEGVEIIASTGFKLLDDAAVKAVRSAEFIPARLAGEPVFSKAEISLEFKLN
jgi:protein TonB